MRKKVDPIKYVKRKPRPKKKINRNKYVVGKILRIPVGIQEKYTDRINTLVARMTKEVSEELTKLFKEDFAKEHFDQIGMDARDFGYWLSANDYRANQCHVWRDDEANNFAFDAATIGSQARILVNKAKKKYDQLFGKLSMGLSPWMADSLNAASATQTKMSVEDMPSLREEGKKLSIDTKTLDLPTQQILKASAARSASFITSIPEQYLNRVSDGVYNSITTGNGLQDLVPMLEKQGSQIANWAHNTAMDQTRKTYNGLNLGRMKAIGIAKGEWIHSGGSQHPRELHEDFDGETFDLDKGAPVGDDGGNYVLPGDENNCRCTFAPVVPIEGGDNDTEEE